MSYLLPHLRSGWEVDQAILSEEERVIIIRFGHDWDEQCMQMDEVSAYNCQENKFAACCSGCIHFTSLSKGDIRCLFLVCMYAYSSRFSRE